MPTQSTTSLPKLIVLLLIFLSTVYLWLQLHHFADQGPAKENMGITHIVQFQFKPDASKEDVESISHQMLGLKDRCIHPTSQKQYIKAVSGGMNNSPEGLNDGLTHIFVVEFENDEDREYYLWKDPAHEEFKQAAGKVLAKVVVVDFTDGVFKS